MPLTGNELQNLIESFDELTTCPNNQQHRMSVEALPIHLEQCPDRDQRKDYISCPITCGKYVLRHYAIDHITLCIARHKENMKDVATQTPREEEIRFFFDPKSNSFTEFPFPMGQTKDEPGAKGSSYDEAANTLIVKPMTAPHNNPVNQLQEYCVFNDLPMPRYSDLNVSGPSHAPIFQVSVTCSAELKMVAYGATKKDAKKEAAKLLLNEIRTSRKTAVRANPDDS